MIRTGEIPLVTKGHTDILDITAAVAQEVARSKMSEGIVNVFTPSSTSGLTTIEYEEGALSDLKRALEEIAPESRDYQHNLAWGDGNGHSHLRAALLGPSLTVPFSQGKLRLGTWQQIVFLDFDNRPRRRSLVVQVVGE